MTTRKSRAKPKPKDASNYYCDALNATLTAIKAADAALMALRHALGEVYHAYAAAARNEQPAIDCGVDAKSAGEMMAKARESVAALQQRVAQLGVRT